MAASWPAGNSQQVLGHIIYQGATNVGSMTTEKPVVAVVGATGHTDRFVVAELLCREMTPVAIARNPAALAAFPHFEVVRGQATVDDAASLDRPLRGVQPSSTVRSLLIVHPAGKRRS